jgi:hypothetical protein
MPPSTVPTTRCSARFIVAPVYGCMITITVIVTQ